VPLPVSRVEVLVETRFRAQPNDAVAQPVGVLPVTVVFQPVHEKPVYVQPEGSPPVLHGREPEATHVIAQCRRDVLVGEAEPVVFEGVYYTLGPRLAGDAGEQGQEVRGEVDVYRPVGDEVVVDVDAALLVPEFPLDSAPSSGPVPQRGLDPHRGHARSVPCRGPTGTEAS
jgi:hypothetical protein